jgi:hypothetical protein
VYIQSVRKIVKFRVISLATILVAPPLMLRAGQQALINDQRLKVSQSLSGHVKVSGSPDALEGVVVEVCGSPWKMKGSVSCEKLLGSMSTDASGNFSFPSIKGKGTYYIRFFKSTGFNPLFVRVQLRRSGTPELTIELPLAS